MKFIINNEEHKIIYIEYSGKIPHSVVTIFYVPNATDGPYWRPVFWDFFANRGDDADIYAYKYGSGGDYKQLQAPQWIDGHTGEFWISPEASFRDDPKNFVQLQKPKRVKGYNSSSINPFKIAEITNNHEYCEVCDNYMIELCDQHQYIDRDGDLRYKHAHHH